MVKIDWIYWKTGNVWESWVCFLPVTLFLQHRRGTPISIWESSFPNPRKCWLAAITWIWRYIIIPFLFILRSFCVTQICSSWGILLCTIFFKLRYHRVKSFVFFVVSYTENLCDPLFMGILVCCPLIKASSWNLFIMRYLTLHNFFQIEVSLCEIIFFFSMWYLTLKTHCLWECAALWSRLVLGTFRGSA